MKPFVYYREERNANGELIDKEYNGINQFNGGRFGKPLYTAEQIEAAVLAEREACAKVCEKRETSYQYATDPWALEHIMEAQYCAAAIRARSMK